MNFRHGAKLVGFQLAVLALTALGIVGLIRGASRPRFGPQAEPVAIGGSSENTAARVAIRASTAESPGAPSLTTDPVAPADASDAV